MDFLSVQEIVESEFSKVIAIGVVVALTLNLSAKVKRKDLEIQGRFTKRLDKKTKDMLWNLGCSDEDIDLIIKIRDSWQSYVICQVMDGLGGCGKKTLKEIVENNG